MDKKAQKESDIYDKDIQDKVLDKEMQNHWNMGVDEVNGSGIYGEKQFIHNKSWYLLMGLKLLLIKGRYYVKVSGSDSNKVVW